MSDSEPILYLCRNDVERACKDIDSVAVIRNVFAMHGSGEVQLPDEAYLSWVNSRGEQVRSLNMPGYLGGSLRVAGTKIINSNIANISRGLPRASGVTLLYDELSARILCIMESAYISSLRTASVTAVAVDFLKGREIQSVAIIGAGVLAKAHIELLITMLPQLEVIKVFDLDKGRIDVLHAELVDLLYTYGVILQAAATAEDAIRSAQLIVPVTTTTTGYIHFSWLQAGSLLVNVSLDDPLPEVFLKASSVIVDDWNLVKNDTRRLIGRMYHQQQAVGPDDPIDITLPTQRRIDAELGDVVVGKKVGRRHIDDIVLMNPFGMAINDIALAAHVYQTARNLGLGVRLEA